MCILCIHYPSQDRETQKVPSLWFAGSSPFFNPFLITQASGMWCLVVQHAYCPALGGAICSRVPVKGSSWGCVGSVRGAGCPRPQSAHECALSQSIQADRVDRIKPFSAETVVNSLSWSFPTCLCIFMHIQVIRKKADLPHTPHVRDRMLYTLFCSLFSNRASEVFPGET